MSQESNSQDGVTVAFSYVPKIAPAVVFSVVFGLMFVFQIVHEKRFKAQHRSTSTKRDWRRFGIINHLFMIAVGVEMGGYIARIFENKNPEDIAPYIILTLFTVLAPNTFTVCLILYFGEVIRTNHAQKDCLLSEWWLTKLFLFQIVLVIGFATAGSVILTNDSTKYYIARPLLITAYSLLLLVQGSLVFVLIHFFFSRSSSVKNLQGKELEFNTRLRATRYYWKNVIAALIAIIMLLVVRNVYRLAAMVEGYGGNLFQHEVYQYVLDATMVALAGILYIAFCNVATLAYVRADFNQIFGYDGNAQHFDAESVGN